MDVRADGLLPLLTEWMPRQRWYPAKGRAPQLRLVDERAVPAADATADVRVLLVADGEALYQVPVVIRDAADVAVAAEDAIGGLPDGRTVVDGPRDRAYTDALLTEVTGHAVHRPAHVLSGEQSNTSIVYPATPAASGVICKIFRQVHPGLNPDIELQTALSTNGCRFVPEVAGQIEGTWTDRGTAHTGSLAFAQEFLPGVEDAWRVALRTAAAHGDFADGARELGSATAAVHADLARVLGSRPCAEADRAAMASGWEHRLDLAAAEVTALAPLVPRIRAVYVAARDAAWPPLQRVHGDYHLGQVLRVPGRGWVLLDFEGEPLRPISERRLLDSAVRDVAGMLRSFDYVAGALAREGDTGAEAWARAARETFLDGYGPVDSALLAAFELDKAVYETLYETRNRPDWVGIPLAAVARLAG